VLAAITAALLEWAANDDGELGPMVDRVLGLLGDEDDAESATATRQRP
jgi:hypothetical protein